MSKINAVSVSCTRISGNLRVVGSLSNILAIAKLNDLRIQLHRGGTSRRDWVTYKGLQSKYGPYRVDVMLRDPADYRPSQRSRNGSYGRNTVKRIHH